MAPSMLRLGAAALACATSAAAIEAYQLKESYDPSNFFDKFNFISGPDLNHGYIKYRTQEDAQDLGLIEATSDEVTLRVDSTTIPGDEGRSSVRLESHNTYNKGLFIADFSHFPKAACGAWPAFWMVGPNWPTDGEIDIYEGWNLNRDNKVVLHLDHPDVVGSCELNPDDYTSSTVFKNCYIRANGQPPNAGCAVDEPNGLYGNPAGGVYAFEWTGDVVRVWSWPQDSVPANVLSDSPDPSQWGKPSFSAGGNMCNVEKAFKDMRIVLNINFCGDAAANNWGECATVTGEATCKDYVQNNPQAYVDTYWKVKSIKVFELEDVQPPTTTEPSAEPTEPSTTEPTVEPTELSTTESTTEPTEPSTTESTAEPAEPTSEVTTTTSDIAPSVTSFPEETTPSLPTSTIPDEPEETDCPEDNEDGEDGEDGENDEDDEDDGEEDEECEEDEDTEPTGSFTHSFPAETSSFTPEETGSFAPTETGGSFVPTSTQSWSTSTIYQTITSTITSCAPAVTSCSARTITTVISIGTTLCPVTTDSAEPTASPSTSSLPDGWIISTIYSTTTLTVTSCPPSITTSCPAQVTTSTIAIGTTICPADELTTTLRTLTTAKDTSSLVTVPVPTDKPETPEIPEVPETPEEPETPEIPEVPETPEEPEEPEQTGPPGYSGSFSPSFVTPTLAVPITSASNLPSTPTTPVLPPVVTAGAGKVVGGSVMAMVAAFVAALVM
ncbi:hypothetical protein VTJ83DRAFT_4067 [Remersonia thermophila]|uniref:GH16 domain-containing protein n=1 Tax=Remersonia thermophila TaxID=72144 RepID=A0ABR4DFU9_9PEZI